MNIFGDEKWNFLNKHVVLLDRLGIDDGIYSNLSMRTGERQKREADKIHNDTILYGFPGQ